MRYRGFEIIIERMKVSPDDGFNCEVFSANDKKRENQLREFELEVGADISDCSDAEMEKGVVGYIDEYYDELNSDRSYFETKNREKILEKIFNWATEGLQNGDLYEILSNSIELTDQEIFDIGAVDLADYFDQNSHAKRIAEYLIDTGTNDTFTGNIQIDFEKINDEFGVELPEDKKMLKKIKSALGEYPDIIAEWNITEQGFDLTFYTLYCPYVSENEIDEDCREQLEMQ